MILWTKCLDNSRPCTKQVKNDTEKQWKKFVADVWKINFSLTLNSMESYHPEHLLVYYKFLKNLNLLRTYSTSGICLLQDPLFYCKKYSINNSVRRLLLLIIVLHSLFADAIDGLRPNSAYADPFWLICGGSICIKYTFFPFRTGKLLVAGYKSVLNIKGFLLQRENVKKSRIVRHTDVISENKRLKCPFVIPLQTIFAYKPDSAMKPSSNNAILLSFRMLNSYGLQFRWH